jgi:hypothetical protein
MKFQDFMKKNIVSLLAIGVSTTSVAVSVAIPGVMGSSGNTGPIGSTGSQGPVGPSGPQGPVGSSGATGSQGPVGPAGENGLTPYIGPNGNWWTGDVDSGITTSTGGFSEENIPFYPINMTASETLLSTRVNRFAEFSKTLTQSQYVQLKVSEDFIEISNAEELFSITNPNGKYVLTQNIDVSELDEWSPLIFNRDPITGYGDPFTGFFDGAGFEIQNLSGDNLEIPAQFYGIGLFEIIGGAYISNITFNNVSINLYDLEISDNLTPDTANNLATSFFSIGLISIVCLSYQNVISTLILLSFCKASKLYFKKSIAVYVNSVICILALNFIFLIYGLLLNRTPYYF